MSRGPEAGPEPSPVLRWLLRLLLGEDDARVLLSELGETYERRRGEEGPAAASRAFRRDAWKGLALAVRAGMRRELPSPSAARPPLPRRSWGGALPDHFVQDTRFGLRSLRRRPLFSLVAILTLGLGIGSATTMFSVVEGILLRPLPFHHPGELLTLTRTIPEWRNSEPLSAIWDQIPLSQPAFRRLQEAQTSFAEVAIYSLGSRTLLGEGEPTVLPVGTASSSLFAVLEVNPILGRTFLPEEDGPAATRVALVSQEIWQERFGSTLDILDRSVNLSGQTFTIVGVLPAGFKLRGFAAGTTTFSRGFWVPLGLDSKWFREDSNNYQGIARLGPHVSRERAEEEVSSLLQGEGSEYRYGARVRSLSDEWTGPYRKPLALFGGAAVILLLIACGNVAALLIGETPGRAGEMATRKALGAGSRRLARQLLTESLLLGVAGGALGACFSLFGTRTLLELAPPIARLEEVGVNAWVLLFAASAGVATSLGFGLFPVLQVARGQAWQGLGAGGRIAGARGGLLHRAVVSGEIALTVLLLVGGGLLARSLYTLLHVDPGFREEGLIEARVSVPSYLVPDPVQRRRIYADLVEAVRPLPGVQAVSGTTAVPLSSDLNTNSLQIVGRPPVPEAENPMAQRRLVYPGYFRTMGIPLFRGRDITDLDRMNTPHVALISQVMAERFWPGQDPIGARFVVRDTITVVGVVGDVLHESLMANPLPTFYLADAQQPIQVTISLVVRTTQNPEALLPIIRQAIRRIEPQAPIVRLATASSIVAASAKVERFRSVLLGIFGSVAVLLAAAGVFGVTARGVETRKREMGVRMALGARSGHVVRATLLPGLISGSTGLLLGLSAALGASRLLSGFLFGVETWDPATYIAVALLMLGVNLAAAYVPARRIEGLEPATVLREG